MIVKDSIAIFETKKDIYVSDPQGGFLIAYKNNSVRYWLFDETRVSTVETNWDGDVLTKLLSTRGWVW